MPKIRGFLILAILLLACVICWPTQGTATSSPNYKISEDFVGGNGGAAGSTNFQAQDTFGGAVMGDTASDSFRTQSGSPTTNDPNLTFAVNSASVNLGDLSTSMTKTGTATFSVQNYTSYGYAVRVLGSPPSNTTHSLTAMSTSAASAPGTEQFGINVVANTSPTTFGANPVQVPSGAGFGAAATLYNVTNMFRFVPGDVIASAPKSSGQTNYTISYVANIAQSTPGGSYETNHTLICTGTY